MWEDWLMWLIAMRVKWMRLEEAWEEWDYEPFGEVGKLFMEFPIVLSFISENLRYKPAENTRHVLHEWQFVPGIRDDFVSENPP